MTKYREDQQGKNTVILNLKSHTTMCLKTNPELYKGVGSWSMTLSNIAIVPAGYRNILSDYQYGLPPPPSQYHFANSIHMNVHALKPNVSAMI